MKASKCPFFSGQLDLLVHILTLGRLYVYLKTRKTIREFLTPTPKKDLCRFLEVGKYCNDFYPDLVWMQSMYQNYKQNAPNEIGKTPMRKLSKECSNL